MRIALTPILVITTVCGAEGPLVLEPMYDRTIALGDQGRWYILDVVEARSSSGATFQKLDDGSLRVSGPLADHDVYTLRVNTTLRGITAIRLDALADDGLPADGPGRARNGNFTVTEFSVEAESRANLVDAGADYSQKDYEAPLAIDGDPATGWSIGNGGEDHWLIAHTTEPIGAGDVSYLTVTIAHQHPARKGYNLGRFRLCATTGDPVPPGAEDPMFRPLLSNVGYAPVPIASFHSEAGAVMSRGEGYAVHLTGGQSPRDTYTLEIRTELDAIAGLRVEAMPGSARRNIAVSELTVMSAPASDPGERRNVSLRAATATYASGSHGPERAIDGNANSVWAASPLPADRPAAAAFEFDSPVSHDGPSVLTLTLVQRAAIPHLRISLSTARQRRYLALYPPQDPPSAGPDEGPSPVERYYNVGGKLYSDPRGRQWLPARKWKEGADGYEGGGSYSTDRPVNALIQRSLSGIDAFRFTVPEGRYRIEMLFAEPDGRAVAGDRRFDIWVERVRVVDDLDPFVAARGVARPYMLALPDVPVSDGQIDVEFFGERPLLSAIALIEIRDDG